MRVAAIDIGKPANPGWAIDAPDASGTELSGCIATIAEALRHGSVALGFVAPQFVPVRHDQQTFTKARGAEGARHATALVRRVVR